MPSDLMRLVPPLRGKFNKLAWMGRGSKVHSEVVPQALVIPSEICSPLLDYPQLKALCVSSFPLYTTVAPVGLSPSISPTLLSQHSDLWIYGNA